MMSLSLTCLTFMICSVDFVVDAVSSALLDVKPLLDSLKYAFLGSNEFLSMIVTSDLDQDQEQKLLDLLRENKGALEWTLGNIKGISLVVLQHRIDLEDGTRPY